MPLSLFLRLYFSRKFLHNRVLNLETPLVRKYPEWFSRQIQSRFAEGPNSESVNTEGVRIEESKGYEDGRVKALADCLPTGTAN